MPITVTTEQRRLPAGTIEAAVTVPAAVVAGSMAVPVRFAGASVSAVSFAVTGALLPAAVSTGAVIPLAIPFTI